MKAPRPILTLEPGRKAWVSGPLLDGPPRCERARTEEAACLLRWPRILLEYHPGAPGGRLYL